MLREIFIDMPIDFFKDGILGKLIGVLYCILLILLVFLIVSLIKIGYNSIEFNMNKKFEKAVIVQKVKDNSYTTTSLMPVSTGKTTVLVPQTIHHKIFNIETIDNEKYEIDFKVVRGDKLYKYTYKDTYKFYKTKK